MGVKTRLLSDGYLRYGAVTCVLVDSFRGEHVLLSATVEKAAQQRDLRHLRYHLKGS